MTPTGALVPQRDMNQGMRADLTAGNARTTVDSESRLTDVDQVHNLNFHRRGGAPGRFDRIEEKVRS